MFAELSQCGDGRRAETRRATGGDGPQAARNVRILQVVEGKGFAPAPSMVFSTYGDAGRQNRDVGAVPGREA